jgi:Tol biopolymer transport system component
VTGRAIALLLLVLLVAAGGAGGAGSKANAPSALAYASDTRGSLDVYVVGGGPKARPRRLTASPRDEFSPSWSADGRWLAYRVNPPRGDEGDIWTMRADGTRKRNLTRSPRVADWSPSWSPSTVTGGRLIAYFSTAGGGSDVWVMRADGSGKRNVTRNGQLNEYPTWSRDGRRLAFNSHRDGQFEVYAAGIDGSRQVNLTRNPAKDQWPAWSPDGKLIAFMSERDGSPDVFVMNADGSGTRNLTRTPALEESHPTWMPDRRLSFTRHGETGPIELWATDVAGSAAVRLAIPAEPVFVFGWKPRSRP